MNDYVDPILSGLFSAALLISAVELDSSQGRGVANYQVGKVDVSVDTVLEAVDSMVDGFIAGRGQAS